MGPQFLQEHNVKLDGVFPSSDGAQNEEKSQERRFSITEIPLNTNSIITINTLRLRKMVTIYQTTFSNAFYWKKM